MTRVRVLHLYANELGINGDRGNVLALVRRLEWRGVQVEVIEGAVGHALPAEVDLVHIGSGPRSARDAVLPDILTKAAVLQRWVTAGVPLIAIGAGMQVLGRRIVGIDGVERSGVGILPLTVRDSNVRAVGEVLGEPRGAVRLAGFVNHGVTIELHEAEALTVLDRGPGNAGVVDVSDRGEGVRVGSLIGTHLGGPVLPMNPMLADELLSAALARHALTLPEPEERVAHVDELARRSRAAIAARLGRAGVEV